VHVFTSWRIFITLDTESVQDSISKTLMRLEIVLFSRPN
jgi:hypothetical protein